MSLFQRSVLEKYLKQQDSALTREGYKDFKAHFHDPAIQANIRESKEEQYQEGFLRDLFVKVLGYTLNPQDKYNLTTEFKNEVGAKKADGAILENGKAIAVIELKGTDTTDLATINTQAFNYKANQSQCVYVVTSNFEKLRFFIDNAVEHIEFDLFNLSEEQFRLLWLCLHRDSLFAGIPKKVKAESVQEEESITKKLYSDYSAFKTALWQDLVKQHPEHDQLLLFKKTQKLLDRFLFVLFSEDKGLLPPNSIREIADQWEKLRDMDAYVPLYTRFQKYFGYLNTGHKGKLHDIFAYNGGLFKPDEVLDSVRITDEVLHPHLMRISRYDFASEVDVNILGHIFEHSLNEIEAITAQLEGRAVDSKKTKRKKDGVFYTPKYITKYIVENTVGRLCAEKKDELAINDEEYARGRKGRQKKTIEALDTKLDVYRDWLLSLTICDPACGSGAFLNQALDFLIAEHAYVNELEAKLLGQSIVFKDIGDHILERNIYGVDINEESVEIARLSLWLRTATKGRKLNDLSANIKCGNSLIDDPAVAGAKAFDWKKEFPTVFAKGGFDVVIGNPPYVSSKGENLPANVKEHYLKSYATSSYQIDLYILFLEKALKLIPANGLISVIVPNAWLNNLFLADVRKHFLSSSHFDEVVSMPENTFDQAGVDTVIVSYSKTRKQSLTRLVDCRDAQFYLRGTADQNDWLRSENSMINVFTSDIVHRLLSKVQKASVPLESFTDIARGVGVYHKRVGHTPEIIAADPYQDELKKDDTFVPYLRGKNVKSWSVEWNSDSFISYGKWLAEPREPKYFIGTRIVLRQIPAERLVATIIEEQFITDQSVFIAKFNEEQPLVSRHGVLAAISSALLSFYFRYSSSEFDRLFPKLKLQHFKSLPIAKQIVASTLR